MEREDTWPTQLMLVQQYVTVSPPIIAAEHGDDKAIQLQARRSIGRGLWTSRTVTVGQGVTTPPPRASHCPRRRVTCGQRSKRSMMETREESKVLTEPLVAN